MLQDFEKLPEQSRIWIYQCNRSFTDKELEIITDKLSVFLNSWQAHGKDLHAGFKLKYKRFIVIAINQDENMATGCSIDASVSFINELEKLFNVDLMDKMNVSFKQGEFVAYKTLSDFREMAKNKSISRKTIVFNNLVTNIQEFNENWEVPASDSWHSRFIK